MRAAVGGTAAATCAHGDRSREVQRGPPERLHGRRAGGKAAPLAACRGSEGECERDGERDGERGEGADSASVPLLHKGTLYLYLPYPVSISNLTALSTPKRR